MNDVYLLLSITVTSSGGLDDDYAARIKSLLMEENLSAGTTIRLQKFIRPIMENVSGVDYIEIRGLLSEKPEIETVVDSSMLTGIVPVQINQQPIISMSGIRVVKAFLTCLLSRGRQTVQCLRAILRRSRLRPCWQHTG